jgi:peptidoglycan/LPS O-acetylase OafA/YrhL
MIAAGFVGLLVTDAIPVHALSAAAIVLGALSWERSGRLPLWSLGVALGDASYSIYLSHVFVLGLTRSLWLAVLHDGGGELAALGFALFSTLVVLAGALACYRWVEAPMTAALHRFWVRPAAVRAEVPPAAAA